jgi:hypothetical protein
VIPIHRQPTLQLLADYKLEGNTDYETFPYKEDIRVSLVAEQKGICAYDGAFDEQLNSALDLNAAVLKHNRRYRI